METKPYSRLVVLGGGAETCGGISAAIDACRAHGVFRRWPVELVATRADGGFLRNARAALEGLRAFARLLLQHRRVVVHVHSVAQPSFWSDCAFMALAHAARCPVILQLHGGGFERFRDGASTPARALIQFSLERAAHVVVPSESLRHWVRSVTREAAVSCIPSAVANPAPGAEANRGNLILFLGRLEQRRGIFELLEATASLRSALPDLRLVCAGEGDHAAVARYAARLGIRDAVKLLGRVGPSGKRALLENAAVFALPCHGAGLPIGLLEAMAAGLPVVTSPTGGIAEAVADGTSGFLVAPGDTATLARVLRKLLEDRALAQRMGAAARETVRLRHAPERTLPRLEELYGSLGLCALEAPPRPAAPRIDLREAA